MEGKEKIKMKYVYILDNLDDENEEFWIELDDEGYALRQMIIGDEGVEISCLTDCLAEGEVRPEDLEGEIKIITKDVFESKWNGILAKFKEEWEQKKKEFTINDHVVGRVKYFYPQGTIIEFDGAQGICFGLPSSVVVGTQLRFYITGYDEDNMWFILDLV